MSVVLNENMSRLFSILKNQSDQIDGLVKEVKELSEKVESLTNKNEANEQFKFQSFDELFPKSK